MKEHPWAVWALFAIIAGLLELLIPYFTFSFVCVAAILGAVAAIWLGWLGQMAAFGATLITSLFLIRPLLLKRFHVSSKLYSRSEQLLLQTGEVIELLSPEKGMGRVVVNGEDWAARADSLILAGQTVQVIGVDGIVLIVKEV